MENRPETGSATRLAHDWVRFVIRRISRHLQPIRDRLGLAPFPGVSLWRPATSVFASRKAAKAQLARFLGGFAPLREKLVQVLVAWLCSETIVAASHQANPCHSEQREESAVPESKTDSSARGSFFSRASE